MHSLLYGHNKPGCSNFRKIIANFWDVGIFQFFAVFTPLDVNMNWLSLWQAYEKHYYFKPILIDKFMQIQNFILKIKVPTYL